MNLTGTRTYMGKPIQESINAVRITDVPVRVHKKTRSVSSNYHKRIQKKWIKRFGYIHEPCMYKTPYFFIVHPQLMPELRMALEVNDSTLFHMGIR